MQIAAKTIGAPKLLTLTRILNNPRVPCKHHYDIWYFVKLNKKIFAPDRSLLAEEFSETRWLTYPAARRRTTDPNTRQAIGMLIPTLL